MKAIPEPSLPLLYSAEHVAQLQRFFGLELASQTAANGRVLDNCHDLDDRDNSIAAGNAFGDLTSATGSMPGSGTGPGRIDDKDRVTTYFQLKQRKGKAGRGTYTSSGDCDQNHENGEQQAENCSEEDDDNTYGPDPPNRYRVHNWFWYGLFSFGAWLGEEYFYFFIFPFSIANLSWWVTRRLLMVWGFCMFIGQSIKEILRWPRPKEPPVVRLESRYYQEYGMPSTHAVVGTLMPFTLLVSTWNHYEYPHMLGLVLACQWTLLVCCSRLYKGMHFILDLIAGVTLTALLMTLIWPWLDTLDHFCLTHPYAPFFIVFTTILLILLYPIPDGVGSSRRDTVHILGTMGGGLCAFWCNHHFGMVPDAKAPLGGKLKWPSLPTAAVMLARYLIFKILTIIMFFGLKYIIKKVIHAFCEIRINEKTKRCLRIQLPYGYVPHAVTMLVVYQLGPRICRWLGLDY